MTRTMTSNAPGSGTSISSSWNASFGSPSRSSRMTQAAIVLGSSPGSVSTRATCVTSTATVPEPRSFFVGRARMLPAELFARLITANVAVGDHDRRDHAAHAEHPERERRVDVPHEPAEVLAEEAGQEGERQEDRGDDRQPRGELVHAQAAHAHPDLEHAGEAIAVGVDLLGDPHEVVVDVAEVVVGLVAAQAGQALDEVTTRREQVALGQDDPADVRELALELEDLREPICSRRAQRLVLHLLDALVDALHEREERVRERVED